MLLCKLGPHLCCKCCSSVFVKVKPNPQHSALRAPDTIFLHFSSAELGNLAPWAIRDWESSWEHPRRWIYLNPENLGVPRLGVTPSHGQHSTHPTASPKPAACTVKGEQTAPRPLLSCLMCVFHMQVLPHSQTGLCPSQANPHLFNINKALIERSIGNLPLHARLGELTKAPVGAGE